MEEDEGARLLVASVQEPQKRQPAENRHGFGPHPWFLACLLFLPPRVLSLSHTQHSIYTTLLAE
jgi:hypothetical protein